MNSEYSSLDGQSSPFLVKNILNIPEVSGQSDFGKPHFSANPSDSYGAYNQPPHHENYPFSSPHNYYFAPTHPTHCSYRAMPQAFNTDYDHSAYSVSTSDSFVYLSSVNNNNNYHKANQTSFYSDAPFSNEYESQTSALVKAEFEPSQLNSSFEATSPVDSSSRSQCDFVSVAESANAPNDLTPLATKSPNLSTTSKYVQGLQSICNSSLTSSDDKSTSESYVGWDGC